MTTQCCQHVDVCGACFGFQQDSASLLELKSNDFLKLAKSKELDLPSLELIPVVDQFFRSKVELSIQQGVLGFFQKGKRDVFALSCCLQLTSELSRLVSDFSQWSQRFPLRRASVRLRVSPQGERGIWLDLSHEETASLLGNTPAMHELHALGKLEFGQKFKNVCLKDDGTFGLTKKRIFYPWFETYVSSANGEIPLYSLIGSFTQTGFLTNKMMVTEILKSLAPLEKLPIMELFCGIGNFSFALASLGVPVRCFERDPFSVEAFHLSLENRPEYKSHLSFFEKDLYSSELPAFEHESLLFVDPPRSGLMQVLEGLEKAGPSKCPKFLYYVSCHSESLVNDLERLVALGYLVEEVKIFDQFPQSHHLEFGVLLKLKNR